MTGEKESRGHGGGREAAARRMSRQGRSETAKGQFVGEVPKQALAYCEKGTHLSLRGSGVLRIDSIQKGGG